MNLSFIPTSATLLLFSVFIAILVVTAIAVKSTKRKPVQKIAIANGTQVKKGTFVWQAWWNPIEKRAEPLLSMVGRPEIVDPKNITLENCYLDFNDCQLACNQMNTFSQQASLDKKNQG